MQVPEIEVKEECDSTSRENSQVPTTTFHFEGSANHLALRGPRERRAWTAARRRFGRRDEALEAVSLRYGGGRRGTSVDTFQCGRNLLMELSL